MDNKENSQSPEFGVLKGEEKLLLEHNYDGIQELDHMLPRWWVWMFYGTVIFSAWYIGYYMSGVGPNQQQELAHEMARIQEKKTTAGDQNPGELAGDDVWLVAVQDSAKVEAGQAVYMNRCMPCHGDKGQGLIGPNLADAYWIHGQGKISDIALNVMKGVPEKGMPPWEAILTPDEMKNVVAFVYTLKGTNPSGAKEPQGEKVE